MINAMPKSRDDLQPGESLCDYCTAKCCQYFALPIETPTCRADLDSIRWYMLHEHVSIFVDSDTWYLMVHTRCRKLRDDHLCGIYETRPQICRDYSTENCEYAGDGCYDQLFETPEQLWEYMEAVFPEPKRKPQPGEPIALPVVG